MKYKNPYYRDRYQNLILTIYESKLKAVILFVIICSLILMTIFQPVNAKFTSTVTILGAIYLLYRLYEFGLIWLKFNPNEKSVIIDKDNLHLIYPSPKEDIEIPLADIDEVIFNMLNQNNEAIIVIKSNNPDLIKIGIDFDNHSVNSLSEENWKVVAKEFDFQLMLNYELDIDQNRDIYAIQKGHNENENISKLEFQEIVSKRTDIKLLGIQEYFNSSKSIIVEPIQSYTIATQFGKESFDFVNGKIAVSYAKDKIPTEIIELTQSANWVYDKL